MCKADRSDRYGPCVLQEFRKRGAVEKIMPPWPKPELQRALPIFPGVSMQLLSARYKKWGGSIRWCLAHALDPGNENLLEAGISATNLAALQAAVDPRKAANVSSLTVAATDHITVADRSHG